MSVPAHIAIACEPWLRERGLAAPVLDWPDPLTEGPLPPRLDAAGVELRAEHWGQPAKGEAELLPHVAGASSIVVWGMPGPATTLLRAWVRSVVEPGVAVLDGQPGGDGDWREHVHPVDTELDRRSWAAATSPDPHSLVDLLAAAAPWADTAATLLRWLPRADTGLNAWQHALLAGAVQGPASVALRIAETLGAFPLTSIGDLTLREELAALEAIGAVTCEGDGWRAPLSTRPLGERLHRGLEKVPLPPRRVAGFVAGAGGWEVEDHERFAVRSAWSGSLPLEGSEPS